MDRFALFEPLGLRRNLLLDCLGGHTPQAPGYLEPDPRIPILVAFQNHVEELARQPAFASDPVTALLLTACRLLTGELSAAYHILENLPAEPNRGHFGQRYCPMMPFRTLSAALPLPNDLADPDRWQAGSAKQVALREWLTEQYDRLRWLAAEGEYRLDDSVRRK